MIPLFETKTIRVRPATSQDGQTIFTWRNHPEIVALSTQQKTVELEEHNTWFAERLNAVESCQIYMVEVMAETVGVVRFDRQDIGTDGAVISVYLHPDKTGAGYGSCAIALGCRSIMQLWPDTKRVIAEVRQDNLRGRKAFLKVGFVHDDSFGVADSHRCFVLERDSLKLETLNLPA